MARSGPCPALLLPLVQLTVCLALASRQSCYDRNYVFRHHMDFRWLSCNRHNSYCNMRMKKMTIYGKPVNTFVHAPSEHLNHICMGNGIPIPPNLLRSTRFYLATTCTYNKTYGNTMMKKQGIYGKILTPFIHVPIPIVNNVCFGGGIPIVGGLHRSKAVFPTTQCRYNPPIHAYTGTPMSQKIVICCCKGLPVLLVG
ncbi:Ribonuclease [Chelonia mydas]|uniref:Ribonuclease n=1 Tax=Chelonia mydas TaxID=8469 RepID=M7BUM5_CHEMY|nr:Ribonuclease [Chelonia mydas]